MLILFAGVPYMGYWTIGFLKMFYLCSTKWMDDLQFYSPFKIFQLYPANERAIM